MPLWLRAETKRDERRTPIIPYHAALFVQAGFKVYVEKSLQRIYTDADYLNAGCELVEAGSWHATSTEHYIIGLKELPVDDFPLQHKHIYYADAFERYGTESLLRRFKRGAGKLYDYEYLVNDIHRQVVSMSHWAGYCGAAIALEIWDAKINAADLCIKQKYYASKIALDTSLTSTCARWQKKPSALIIGAYGNAGKGVIQALEQLGIPYTAWDKRHTSHANANKYLLEHDILFNCAALKIKTEPFLTTLQLTHNQRLSLIQDISCFVDSHFNNALPMYSKTTSFDKPTQRIADTPVPVDIIAIDHLPTYLPRESSNTFSSMLFPHLLQLLTVGPNIKQSIWATAEDKFHESLKRLQD